MATRRERMFTAVWAASVVLAAALLISGFTLLTWKAGQKDECPRKVETKTSSTWYVRENGRNGR